MDESRRLLQHFLAALKDRTEKVLRGAPEDFPDFRPRPGVRTPKELVWHMTGVISSARAMIQGGQFTPADEATYDEELQRFRTAIDDLHGDLGRPDLKWAVSEQELLQGPLVDAMTHVGQLAVLRRLLGKPTATDSVMFAGLDRHDT